MTRLRKQCLMTERRWRQRDVIVTVTVTPAQSLRLVTACTSLLSSPLLSSQSHLQLDRNTLCQYTSPK